MPKADALEPGKYGPVVSLRLDGECTSADLCRKVAMLWQPRQWRGGARSRARVKAEFGRAFWEGIQLARTSSLSSESKLKEKVGCITRHCQRRGELVRRCGE